MRRIHFSDTTAYPGSDSASAGADLHAACSKAASATTTTTTVCAACAAETTGNAAAIGNPHSSYAEAGSTCCAAAATKTVNTGIHTASATSDCADRGIANITDDTCA